jgi:Transmembrane secretion effector
VTVTVEMIVRPEDREEFLKATSQLRLIFLRNGATLYRIDENLENPGTFRSEMIVHSWAEHLRQHARSTKEETALANRIWEMHAGAEPPVVRHYLQANRLSTPMEFSHFRKHEEGAANFRMTGLGQYEVQITNKDP